MACCLAALLLFFAPSGLRAQTGVAATVGDQDIRMERLQLQVELVLARTPAEGQKLEIIKAQVLEENIKQRLVNIYLQQSKFKATSAEVELELSNFKRELVEGNSSFENQGP